jgi:hypothetical protein
MMRHLTITLCTVLLLGSASLKNPQPPPLKPETEEARLAVRHVARTFLGNNAAFINCNGKTYANDCSGMTLAAFEAVGVNLFEAAERYPGQNGVSIIYNTFRQHRYSYTNRLPRPGDLVFFKNTYDKNKNGKWDDYLTHVAIVEGVSRQYGTVSIIHHVSTGVQRYMMNHRYKKHYMYKGQKMNDFLRRAKSESDKAIYNARNNTGYYNRWKFCSANLFYCYIDVLAAFPELRVAAEAMGARKTEVRGELQAIMQKYGMSAAQLQQELEALK